MSTHLSAPELTIVILYWSVFLRPGDLPFRLYWMQLHDSLPDFLVTPISPTTSRNISIGFQSLLALNIKFCLLFLRSKWYYWGYFKFLYNYKTTLAEQQKQSLGETYLSYHFIWIRRTGCQNYYGTLLYQIIIMFVIIIITVFCIILIINWLLLIFSIIPLFYFDDIMLEKQCVIILIEVRLIRSVTTKMLTARYMHIDCLKIVFV